MNLTVHNEKIRPPPEGAWRPVFTYRRKGRSVKGHKEPHVLSFMKTCCFPLSSFIFWNVDWAHKTVNNEYSSSWPNVPKFQRKVQPNIVLTIELSVYVFSLLLSLFLSIWRWKDLSCCFLLLHYLLLCGALLAGFISDFAGCFWRSLWNVFLTPNNPLPAFSPAFSHSSKWIEPPCEAKIHPILS